MNIIAKKDIGSITREVLILLKNLKIRSVEFNSVHPQSNIERVLFLLDEAIEKFNYFLRVNSVPINEYLLNHTIEEISHNIKESIRILIFFETNKKNEHS